MKLIESILGDIELAGETGSWQIAASSEWYADGILDTLIETDQDTVFHFPTECSEIF